MGVQGVLAVEVDLAAGLATIRVDDGVTDESLRAALVGSDYTTDSRAAPEPVLPKTSAANLPRDRQEMRLRVTGMSCAACVGRVQRVLAEVPGVGAAHVNFATETATIECDASVTSGETEARVKVVLAAAGYPVREDGGDARMEEMRDWKRRWIAGAILSGPVVVIEMGAHWTGEHDVPEIARATILLLTTTVVAWLGGGFATRALRSLRRGVVTMDSLITLGVGAAYGASLVAQAGMWLGRWNHAPVYFESAAVILTLVAFGKWLEARARHRAGEGIRALSALAPPVATLLRGEAEELVSIDRIAPGDLLLVRPGEKIPTDAVVEDGVSEVDESAITGESMPVPKAPGDAVIGSALNGSGMLRVRATRVGKQTALARIVALVERAQEGRSASQRLADQVSQVFVPIVLVLALATLLVGGLAGGDWAGGFTSAVAILVVACPCALGLATPTALMVAVAKAARLGILLRDAQALEGARAITTVVLDKTGTVTEGRPSVDEVCSLGTLHEREWLPMLASIERPSEHPLAKALVRYAEAKGIALGTSEEFRAIPGQGVHGRVAGRSIRVSAPRFVSLPPSAAEQATMLEARGRTVLVAEVDEVAVGLVGLSDQLKQSSRGAVAELRQGGRRVRLLTGDNRRVALAIAAELGLKEDDVLAEVRPEEKEAEIRRLQRAGEKVAMVGDGINDAPSLAAADLGIAMGGGTDVAMEAATMTLLQGDLRLVPQALQLGAATVRTIRQNLFWAFAYNVVLIPVAAAGMLSPMAAGGAMALSSVSVVFNSLRLGRQGLRLTK
jgi:Cu+-exporting ATPase